MNDYYLMHYGIKGQKWGIRRFQNEDGSYTAAGRKRRNKSNPEETRKKFRKAALITAGLASAGSGTYAIGRKLDPTIAKIRSGEITKDDLKKKAKSVGNDWFSPKIKVGKDKPNISKAEKIIKEASGIAENSGKILNAVNKARRAKGYEEFDQLIYSMSDDEIRRRTQRLNLETSYIDAMNRRETVRGRVTAQDIMSAIGSAVAIGGGVAAIVSATKVH